MTNILIILTDQLSDWSLSCYGNKYTETKHIDRLAKEGVKFNQFFTPSAVCTPSRGCFMTGRYPHINGAYKNDVPLNRDEITFAQVLKENGYITGCSGKWHLNGGEYPGWIQADHSMGFDETESMFNCGHYKKVVKKEGMNPLVSFSIGDEKTYMTDWLTDQTIKFIKKPHNNPFCYMVSYPDPHQPYTVREPYKSMFNPSDMDIPESFFERKLPDWADQDEWGRKRYFPIEKENREQELRKIKARYLGEVKCIDDNIGRMISALEEQGILEDTMIIFTSDHGEYMGEHGLLEKNNLYESVYKLPFIIRWPKKIAQNLEVDTMTNIIDFKQTLLSILNMETTGNEQGRDLSKLLFGQKLKNEEIYIHPSDVPRAGIITEDYELAYVGQGFNRENNHSFKDHILFDRKKDPNQLENLYEKSEYKSIIFQLNKKMKEHFKNNKIPNEVLPKGVRYE